MSATTEHKSLTGIKGIGLTGKENQWAIYLLVRNLNEVLEITLADCTEFQSTSANKLSALKQLLHIVALAEGKVGQYSDKILQTLATILFSFDDKEFIDIVDSIASCLGSFVDGRIIIPIVLKNISIENAKSSTKTLTNYMKLATCLFSNLSGSSVVDSLEQIVSTLQSIEQLYLDYHDIAVLGAKFLDILVDKASFSLANHSSVIFNIFLAMQSTIHQKEGSAALEPLAEKLAKVLGYSSSSEMYSAEVKDFMERLYLAKDYKSWHKFSKDRFKFEVILRHCKEGIPTYIEPILDVISTCTQPDKDPELKFDMLVMLEFIIDSPSAEECLRTHSLELIKRILIQTIVWRSGKPSIKIRKAAIVLYSKVLNKKLIQPESLHKLYQDTVSNLKNCLDDDWASDLRLVSIQFLRQLIEYLKDKLDQIELSNLYQLLLARLDDAQDTIRIETTGALKAFFACPNMYMSDSVFEYVCQTLFVHLDDKNEEVQLAVFRTLELAATYRKELVLQEAKKSLPKQKFPRLCEKLISLLSGQSN